MLYDHLARMKQNISLNDLVPYASQNKHIGQYQELTLIALICSGLDVSYSNFIGCQVILSFGFDDWFHEV